MSEPELPDLSLAEPASFDTNTLKFVGLRGDSRLHLDRAALHDALGRLPPAPRDEGRLELIVARGPQGERNLPQQARLTPEGGLPGDRWAGNGKYGPDYQLAVTRFDYARVVANGQPIELHGDNLYLSLDLSDDNLPTGSLLRIGGAVLRVTPQAHNGCKKWAQRFGLASLQLNMTPQYQRTHLRGIYLCAVEPGLVSVGDTVTVVERAQPLERY